MKKTLIIALLTLVTLAGQAQIHYRLEGNIGHPEFTASMCSSISGHRGVALVEPRFPTSLPLTTSIKTRACKSSALPHGTSPKTR